MARRKNNWETSYSHISFLERALSGHTCLDGFSRTKDILFTVERKISPLPTHAVLVGRYVISLADVLQAKAEFPEMDCIVAYGAWCGYTEEAKEHGLENGIAVFQAVEFLKALCARDFIGYAEKTRAGSPIYYYKNS